MALYMTLIPAVEAAEQTVIQKIVPFRTQGRVFGFAQAFESAAAPITAFAIAPIAQFLIIPYMDSRSGQDAFGWLLGEGTPADLIAANSTLTGEHLSAYVTKRN